MPYPTTTSLSSFPIRTSSEPTLRDRVRGCRLFRELEEDELDDVVPRCSILRLERGEALWRRGDEGHRFHYIVRGLVEIRRPAGSYDTTLMAFFGPTEVPAVPIALSGRSYGADAQVMSEDAIVLTVSADYLRARMTTDPRIAMAINRALLAQMRLMHGKIDVMSAGTVPRRLALFLLNLADRFGDEFESGDTIVPFTLTRHQIATYINARVETVIRALSVWRKSGLVDVGREEIAIHDADSLRRSLAD